MGSGAEISQCGKYRYVLYRRIHQPIRWNRPACFIMLNPSTADAEKDDPTIRRCLAFAKREGCTSLTVVNLFAYRATNPRDLEVVEDPIGPENDRYLERELSGHGLGIIVAAWGARPFARERAEHILDLYGPFKCLGKNVDGSPKHPLYVRADTVLEEISGNGAG